MPKEDNKNNINVLNLTYVNTKRFHIFMKFIADNNLWEEAVNHLEAHGCTSILVSDEPIRAIQRLLLQKLSAGELDAQRERGRPIAESATCGAPLPDPHTPGSPSYPGYPGPPPKPE